MYQIAIAELAVNVARGLFTLTLGMLLYKLTGNLWAFTLVYVSEFLASFLLQGFAGSAADSFGARKVLLVTLSLLVSALAILCVSLGENVLSPVALTGVALAVNFSRPFIVNAVFVLTAEIAKARSVKVERVTGALSVATQSGQILGMVLAGVAIESQLQAYVIPVTTVGFAIAFAAYLSGAPRRDPGLAGRHPTAEGDRAPVRWFDAFKYIRENPRLALCIAFGSLDFVTIAIFNLLLAPVVSLNYGNEGRWLTIIDVSFAVGAIAGGIFVLRSKMLKNRFAYSLCSLSSAAVLFMLYAVDAPPILVVGSILAYGFLLTLSVVGWSSSIQDLSPDWLKGRISAVRNIAMSICVALAVTGISFVNDFSTLAGLYVAAIMAFVLMLATIPFFLRLRGRDVEAGGVDEFGGAEAENLAA